VNLDEKICKLAVDEREARRNGDYDLAHLYSDYKTDLAEKMS
jgi:hypothetical protein